MRSVAIGRSRPLISKNLYEQKLNGSAEKVDVGLQTAAELGIINNESSELDTLVKWHYARVRFSIARLVQIESLFSKVCSLWTQQESK